MMAGFDFERFRLDLIDSEAYKRFPYVDTVGKLTIGCGWNLSDNGLPDDIIEELLRRSMYAALNDAKDLIPTLPSMSPSRQRALAEMAFNLGRSRLAGFRGMISALAAGNFQRAADEAMDSKWARQVGRRASRIAAAIREG